MTEEQEYDVIFVFKDHTTIKVFPKNQQIRNSLFYHFKVDHWDGDVQTTVYLYEKQSKGDKLPIGLLHDVLVFCSINKYTVAVDPKLKFISDITPEELQKFIETLKLPFELRDYQFDMIYDAIKYKKITQIAATSSGKSLVIYCLIRYFTDINPTAKKFLIVPSVLLVDQMVQDFKDYSINNGWNVDLYCAKIYSGNTKYPDQDIVVSTWQSLQFLPDKHFKKTEYLIIDEVHGGTATKLKNITKKSINSTYKIGMTGTLKNNNIHEKQIKGLFGIAKTYITAKELIQRGLAPPLNIHALHLEYSNFDRAIVSGLKYLEEVDWICEHPIRKMITVNLPNIAKGNNLFLFNFKEKHLYPVLEEMSKKYKDVFNITGSVPKKRRMQIKLAAEHMEDLQLLATFGTMSTGVSIKKLHNLIICQCSKSNIRIIQSIGRILRMHESIDEVNVYILIDDLEFNNRKNRFLIHALETLEIIKNEGHEIKFQKINMQNMKKMLD